MPKHGGFSIRGLKALRKTLLNLSKNYPEEVARALYKRGHVIMTRSKEEFVPVAEEHGGTLRASGQVSEPEKHAGMFRVVLAYGGAAWPYAEAVHEHLSEHSPPSWIAAEKSGDGVHFHPEGRGPKYLERPLMEAMSTLAGDLAKDVRTDLVVAQSKVKGD